MPDPKHCRKNLNKVTIKFQEKLVKNRNCLEFENSKKSVLIDFPRVKKKMDAITRNIALNKYCRLKRKVDLNKFE